MRMTLKKPARDLDGQVAVVTGGARGIGRATAIRLLAAGMQVAIGDKDAIAVKRTADEIGALGVGLDVVDPGSWEHFLDIVIGEFGPIDVLINNAGIMPIGRVLSEPEAVARAVFDVNVHGTINGLKAVAPGMVARRRGHIVNISSAVGRVPARGGATYTASKHAVVGFTDAVRQELGPDGVEVSMVLPSIIRTELSAGVPDMQVVPTQTPEDVATVIEDVLRRPVPEAWVPRWTQPMSRAAGILPRRAQAVILDRMKGNVLDDHDSAARADYEALVRGTAAGD